jgi:hypothetical protein
VTDHHDPSQSTRDWIDLKIAAFRSEVRLLFVVSVAGNQLLSHLSLSPALGYLSNVSVLVGAFIVKIFVLK